MTVPLRPLLLSVLAALAVALAPAALAQGQGQGQGQGRQDRGTPVRGADAVRTQGQPPAPRGQDAMADSIRHIGSSTRGRVLSAERMHSDGREINRIKVVDDRGRVRVYEDDPQQRRQRSRRDDD